MPWLILADELGGLTGCLNSLRILSDELASKKNEVMRAENLKQSEAI